jgi:hypothetical protein
LRHYGYGVEARWRLSSEALEPSRARAPTVFDLYSRYGGDEQRAKREIPLVILEPRD